MPDAAHRLLHALADPFLDGRRPAWWVIVAFVFINALVLTNAVLHDPRVGYDASAHLKYATTLASGRLPNQKDTHEFFSPPLPYVPAALLWASLDAGGRDGRDAVALKLAQLVQVVYSIVLTFFVIKIARLLRPDHGGGGTGDGAFLSACTLLCLGIVPAYYRTFAMIRGEPLLATLAVVGTYLTLRTFAFRRPTLGAAALVGLTLGLAVVSRQWAFFVLPALGAVGLWRLVIDPANRGATVRAGLMTLVVFAVVATPFYLRLHYRYGSVKAFNRDPVGSVVIDGDRAAGDPAAQRLGVGEALKVLVTRPVRDLLDGHPLLLFHADVWGDYWQYYVVHARNRAGNWARAGDIARVSRDARAGPSNYRSIRKYLGRQSVAGVVPTALFAIGTLAGLWGLRRAVGRDAAAVVRPALALCVVGTVAGYAWFVASYPDDRGDTIKASYPLQLYAPLAILAAAWIAGVRDRSPRLAWALVPALLLVGLHGVPACVTRYF